MNRFARSLLPVVIAIGFFSPNLIFARGLNEGAALNLLLRVLKRDHVYDKRISLDCVTFNTDETTRTYFEFSLHEHHSAKCGGDPDTTPVVDRYRVRRASGELELYDAASDSWRPYNPAKTK